MAVPRKIGCVCLSLVAVLVLQGSLAVGSPAEELAKRLPDNTIGFVATSGGDALKGDFDKSILGRLWNDPNMRAFCTPLWTQLRTALSRKMPDANSPKYVYMAMDDISLFGSRPIIIGVAQAPVKKGPPICGFAILDAGDRKTQLTEALANLEAQAGKDRIVELERASLKMHSLKDANEAPLYWGWAGNYFVVAVNDTQDAVLQYVNKPRAAVPDCFKKVPGTDDMLMVHYDCQKIVQIARSLVAQKEGGDVDPNTITKVLTQLGLDKVAGITARVGFSGPDMVKDGFIEVPEPRAGLLAAFKPLDLALFGLVDPNAVEASAVNCDIGTIYDTVLNTVKAVAPEKDYTEFHGGLAKVESEVKINIRKDMLGSLAGPVVFYNLPAGKMVDAPMGGFVAVVKLKDPATFEKAMVALGAYIKTKSGGNFQISDQNDGGRTTHIWSVPALAMVQMMPTWSVIGDNLVFGSNMALHRLELKYVTPGAPRPTSLLDNEGYEKIAARLPKNVVSFRYVDSRAQLSGMMMGAQQFWPLAIMAATKAGVTLPVMLPNLDRVIRQAQPGCRYACFDADGLHTHYQGSGVEAAIGGVAGGAVAMAVALPAVARARDQARRTSSMANLKQIGLACFTYSNGHGDRLPPDLETLVKGGQLESKVLESANKPKDFKGPSFIYISGQTVAASSPSNITAYENPEFCTDGINVLFLDGHVEFVKPQQFREQLAETYKRLGREMPPVQFKGEAKPAASTGPSTKG